MDNSVSREPLIVEHKLTGKWFVILRDLGATEPLGPFDTKEEAEAKVSREPVAGAQRMAADEEGVAVCKNCGETIRRVAGVSYWYHTRTLWLECDHRAEPLKQSDPVAPPTYEDCSLADAQAAEQWAVAYVAKVGVSKETMIDAVSTLRAQLLTSLAWCWPVALVDVFIFRCPKCRNRV